MAEKKVEQFELRLQERAIVVDVLGELARGNTAAKKRDHDLVTRNFCRLPKSRRTTHSSPMADAVGAEKVDGGMVVPGLARAAAARRRRIFHDLLEVQSFRTLPRQLHGETLRQVRRQRT